MLETKEYGFDKVEQRAWELGSMVRKYMCEEKGLGTRPCSSELLLSIPSLNPP